MEYGHVFIINPISGDGKGEQLAEKIRDACKRKGWSCEICFTRKDMSAAGIAASYKEKEGGPRVIWAVGGDGTLHQVLNGMAGSSNCLGLLPHGSGNDFARTVREIPNIQKIDIGRINGRYFLNTVCFGIDGQVANNVDLMRRSRVPAAHRYTASILYTLITHREKKIRFLAGGEEKEMKSTVLTLCNGRYYGGGYRIAPDARLDDGLLELIYTGYIRRPFVIPLLLKLKANRLFESKKIHMEQVRSLTVSSDVELLCNVDGEVLRGKTFSVEVLPKEVSFFRDQELEKMVLSGLE